MKIDIEKLDKLVERSDQIFLEPEGEEVLLNLLKIQEQVDSAIKTAKEKLEEKALKISPDFKSIAGDRIKVYYRYFGSKYYIDESKADKVPDNLKTKKVRYYLKTKELEKWVDEHGALPEGVKESDRKKQITFSVKKEEDEDKEK